MRNGGIYQWKRRRAMEEELQHLAESTCAFVLDDDWDALQCCQGIEGHPLYFPRGVDSNDPMLQFLRERCWADDGYYTVPFEASGCATRDPAVYRLFG
jgi:hypothetical protein